MEQYSGMQFAYNCPHCSNESASLETQEFAFDGDTMTITSGFMCFSCTATWWQTIEFTVGTVIKNETNYQQ